MVHQRWVSRRRYLLPFITVLLVLVALISAPLQAFSQTSDSSSFINDLIQAASSACDNLQRGEVCLGSPSVTAAFQEGTTGSLDEAGSVSPLAGLASVASSPADEDAEEWGVTYFRVGADLPDDGLSNVTLVGLGETTLTNTAVAADSLTTCVGKNLNTSLLNIFSGPSLNSSVVGVLTELEKVTVNGRSSAGDFFRIQRDGLLGWVAAENIAIDCDAATLAVGTEGDVSVLYTEPMQAFTVDTTNDDAGDAPNALLIQSPLGKTAHLLANGVQIDASGSGYVTAVADGELAITGLQGSLNVTAGGKTVTVLPGFVTRVTLAELTASGEPTDPEAAPEDGNGVDLLNSLVFGQPFDGAGSTTSGFAIHTSNAPVAVDDVVRLDLSFSGDAASCTPGTRPFLDVVFAVDASETMEGANLDAARAAIGHFVAGMNPDTDQVGAVSFSGQATTLSALSADLDRTVSGLEDIKTESARSIDLGLAAAYSSLKAGRADAATRAIILLTSGSSDATLATRIAGEIKNAGIRLITVGIGSGADTALLESLATDGDALVASSAVNTSDVVETALLKLTQSVAARDLKVSFKVDDDKFAVAEDLLAASGGSFDGDTIQWEVPAVWNTQTVHFPIVLKALEAGDASPGSAQLSYSPCADGSDSVQSDTIAASVASVAEAPETVSLNDGVLADGAAGDGTLAAFGQQVWALNAPDAQTVSVTTSGTQAPLLALLTGPNGTVIEPLYTLPGDGDETGDLSVFFVPEGGLSWLYLQSDSANAAGKYTIEVNAGGAEEAADALVADAEPLKGDQGEGSIYSIDGKAGDTLTLRYTAQGNAPLESPLRVFSLDGQLADEVFTQFDKTTNQWVSLDTLQGSGPYRILVRSSTPYSIGVETGDTLTNARGPIQIGETRATDAKNSKPSVFSYTLDVPDNKLVSVILSGSATESTLRNADNQVIAQSDRIAVNDFKIDFYNLTAGLYTVLIPVEGTFRISVADGDVTQSLKGTLGIGQTREQSLGTNEKFAAYNIVEGSRKPLVEGDVITLTLDATEVDANNVYIESSDGIRSALVASLNDVVDRSTKRVVSVHQLAGVGPFRVIVTNLNRFVVRFDIGDLLTNNKGSIVVGQQARDSSRAPQYLIYTLAPQLGKELVEGDIVTINFLNQANTDKPFFTPFLEDGKENAIKEQGNGYLDQGGRQFIGVYQLTGQPPYRLTIPNIGAYVLSVEIGNNLDVDRGAVKVGTDANGGTNGPQLVHYTLDLPEGQTITTRLSQTSGRGSFSDVKLVDADGNELTNKRSIYDGAYNRVYVLKGKGPYALSFQMDGGYNLSISDGDKLTLDKGAFFMGDAEVDQVASNLGVQVVAYSLNLKAGQTITTQLFNEFYYSYELYDPNGNIVDSTARWYSRDASRQYNQQRRYTVRDEGTYELAFPMAGKYTLRVTDGDELTVVKGNVYFNVQETDVLPLGKVLANYTINAEEGQTITMEYIPGTNNSFLASYQIRDADGNLVYPGQSLALSRYQLVLYELQGPAPYTLTIEPRNSFKLKISDSDTLNINRGVLAYDQEITDTPVPADAPKNAAKLLKRFIYDLDAEPGDKITIQLTEPRNSFTYSERVFDGGMNLLTVNAANYDSGKRIYTISYTLTGEGPYQFWFDVADEYKLLLTHGDTLTADLGALTEGAAIDQQLEKPAIVAHYTVDGAPGDIVSILANPSGEPVLTNAAGEFALLLDQSFSSQNNVYVYQLTGEGPYDLRFLAERRYKLNLALGNALIQDLGSLPINAASDLANPDFKPVETSAKLDAPARYAAYLIDGADGDQITVRLNARGSSLAPLLVSSDGQFIDAQATYYERDTVLSVYQLKGTAPYALAFDAPNQFKITLDEGDTLRVDAGTIPTGILEEPFENELPKTARFAIHTLDVAPGQLITLQIENSRNFVPVNLRDGDGKIIEPEFLDFQGGKTNVDVYILSGSGPYTATFPVTGKYTASVAALNLLRVDKGIIDFGTPVEDELDDPGRVATYLVDGKRDQIVTIELQAGNRPIDGEFRDANGKLWLPDYQVIQNNALFNVYRLGGPAPYDITFGSDQKYTIAVSDGNVLRSDQGNLPIGEKVTGTLEAPSQVAVYSLASQAGETVSVALQAAGRAVNGDLYNADGELLRPIGSAVKNNVAYNVYDLSGASPYRLEFVATRQYNVTVTPGNVLRADLGPVTLNEKISKTLPSPAVTAVYTVDATSQFLSVQLQVGGQAADGTLYDADGEKLEPDATINKLNSTFKIYTLPDNGPYRLEFNADRQYAVTVTPGNVLRADQGVIRFNNVATTTLRQPAEAAIYTIDAQPGQVISLQLQDNGRPAISELHDADGNLILPWGLVNTTNASFSVYTLSGTAPYKITFLPKGRYSLALKEGNFFLTELGTIPFGQKITNRLPVPARTAIYTINTESDQVISAQIVNRGSREFVEAKLVNADGEEIVPQTEVFDGTNTSTSVYTLTGPAPYTFQFDVTGQYDLTFSRGDVTDPNFVPVGPQSVPQTIQQ